MFGKQLDFASLNVIFTYILQIDITINHILFQEIRLLHECKMPNGAKEIAKEAVRLKRQNEKLTEQLQNLTKSTAPGLDPVFFEKLEEIKSDNEVMVRKIVLYQKQLNDLKLRHPDEEIIIDFQETME